MDVEKKYKSKSKKLLINEKIFKKNSMFIFDKF